MVAFLLLELSTASANPVSSSKHLSSPRSKLGSGWTVWSSKRNETHRQPQSGSKSPPSLNPVVNVSPQWAYQKPQPSGQLLVSSSVPSSGLGRPHWTVPSETHRPPQTGWVSTPKNFPVPSTSKPAVNLQVQLPNPAWPSKTPFPTIGAITFPILPTANAGTSPNNATTNALASPAPSTESTPAETTDVIEPIEEENIDTTTVSDLSNDVNAMATDTPCETDTAGIESPNVSVNSTSIDDLCSGVTCGANAQCSARRFRAVCQCQTGFEGDPYTGCTQSECVGKIKIKIKHFPKKSTNLKFFLSLKQIPIVLATEFAIKTVASILVLLLAALMPNVPLGTI